MPSDRTPRPFRASDLARRQPLDFQVEPDQATRAALAADLGIIEVRKLRFQGSLEPEGKRDWRLEGTLGATIVQPCIVSLAPVVTRIDDKVIRHYLAHWVEPDPGTEIEMPDDETIEPLGTEIDPAQVMAEALALALPDYPRADGAELGQAAFTEPGATPLSDADVHPFAELAKLKGKSQ